MLRCFASPWATHQKRLELFSADRTVRKLFTPCMCAVLNCSGCCLQGCTGKKTHCRPVLSKLFWLRNHSEERDDTIPVLTYCCSPNSVDTLGLLTVVEKQLCLDRCAARACPANSLLFTVHSCLSTSSMCISTAQARRIWGPAAGASSDCALVVLPCAFSRMVVTFRGRCEGNLVFWYSKDDFS